MTPAPVKEMVDLSEEEGEAESHRRSSTCKEEKFPVGRRAPGVSERAVGVN